MDDLCQLYSYGLPPKLEMRAAPLRPRDIKIVLVAEVNGIFVLKKLMGERRELLKMGEGIITQLAAFPFYRLE